MAARGMKTSYYKKKSPTPMMALMALTKELRKKATEHRRLAKQAQADKEGASDEERKRLEEIRASNSAQSQEVRQEIKEVNKKLSVAEEEGKLSSKEQLARIQEDFELRNTRMDREEDIRTKVQEDEDADEIEDLGDEAGKPTRARIRGASRGIRVLSDFSRHPTARTQKKNVIISGEQGFKNEQKQREDELNEILEEEALGIERDTPERTAGKQKKVKLKAGELELTKEMKEAGKKLRKERGEGPTEEEKLKMIDVAPRFKQTRQDKIDERETAEMFIDLETLFDEE